MFLQTWTSTSIPVQLSTLGYIDCDSECRSRGDSSDRDVIVVQTANLVTKKKDDGRGEFVFGKVKHWSQ
jgi:hypothetical protein